MIIFTSIFSFLFGFIFSLLFKRSKEIHGFIDHDKTNDLCRIKMTSNEIRKLNKKYAILKINHNAEISRDEQTL